MNGDPPIDNGPSSVDALIADAQDAEKYAAAIRKHRDARGDDRCWLDDEALYSVLPEGYTPPASDTTVELENCRRFIECRQNPGTEYVSPQRRIEELEADAARWRWVRENLAQMHSPKMDGQHSWRFRPLRCTGKTVDEAIDKEMTDELPRQPRPGA